MQVFQLGIYSMGERDRNPDRQADFLEDLEKMCCTVLLQNICGEVLDSHKKRSDRGDVTSGDEERAGGPGRVLVVPGQWCSSVPSTTSGNTSGRYNVNSVL